MGTKITDFNLERTFIDDYYFRRYLFLNRTFCESPAVRRVGWRQANEKKRPFLGWLNKKAVFLAVIAYLLNNPNEEN